MINGSLRSSYACWIALGRILRRDETRKNDQARYRDTERRTRNMLLRLIRKVGDEDTDEMELKKQMMGMQVEQEKLKRRS